jgi:N-acetylmuramic acid 6-phosphate etherase
MFRAVEGAEDDEVRGAEELLADGVMAGDVVVGLSASGGAPYVLGALKKAREIGAIPLGITCNPDSRMHPLCDVTIAPYVGPEVITGSSRLKAGTAQKLILNMLSTGAMIKTGKVVGNLMVNVRPTNAKLRDRCIRILMELGSCDRDTATMLIDKYGDIRKSLDDLDK